MVHKFNRLFMRKHISSNSFAQLSEGCMFLLLIPRGRPLELISSVPRQSSLLRLHCCRPSELHACSLDPRSCPVHSPHSSVEFLVLLCYNPHVHRSDALIPVSSNLHQDVLTSRLRCIILPLSDNCGRCYVPHLFFRAAEPSRFPQSLLTIRQDTSVSTPQ